ncbi:trans-sialidase, putative, partial [Trypanosoma cruzi marinkellei]
MHSRVAAVKAPRTHNRRRVTGSSGRRREGRESEPQRPNMSRRVFPAAVLLLFVVMMYCGSEAASAQNGGAAHGLTSSELRLNDAIDGEGSASGGVKELQRVDLFVPQTTQVLPKDGTGASKRDSFLSPSLVSAGGVIAAFAEGHMKAKNLTDAQSSEPIPSDIVAGYIDSAWNWTTLVDKANQSTLKAHTVLGKAEGTGSLDVVLRPTTVTKGNRVFLLAGRSVWSNVNGSLSWDSLELTLVVGTVTNSTGGEPSGRISWNDPKSLLSLENPAASHERNMDKVFPSGGSGVLMEGGTLVFPVIAFNEAEDVLSMIIYSTDNGSTWVFSNGTSSANCENPRITEWEGSLLMIVDCESGQRVYESRDMGRTWTEARGTLPGVWFKSKSGVRWDGSFRVEALITATIGGRKVMLYTQRGYASRDEKATALYVWVTDNNRSFSVGPVAMEDGMNWDVTSTLLYSDGNLHVLQQRDNGGGSAISLSRLTDELSAIESVLSTWAQKDIFFSNLSIPTAGLVAVLSNASANNNTWNDEYLCLNATVTNAKKVKDGVQLTDPDSRVIWSVNTRDNNLRHVFLSHNFTLV